MVDVLHVWCCRHHNQAETRARTERNGGEFRGLLDTHISDFKKENKQAIAIMGFLIFEKLKNNCPLLDGFFGRQEQSASILQYYQQRVPLLCVAAGLCSLNCRGYRLTRRE